MALEYVNPVILSLDQLLPGDLLLCFSPYLASQMKEETGSEYAHTAICLKEGEIAESSSGGVRKTTLDNLLDEYSHIAILRNRYIWDSLNLNKLSSFIDNVINVKAGFNIKGMAKLKNRKKVDQSDIQKLQDFFAGEISPANPIQKKYFCSELVTAAFYAIGIWGDSVAIIFDHRFSTPAGIIKEPTYGEFIGYLLSYDDYLVPETDEFFKYGDWYRDGVKVQ